MKRTTGKRENDTYRFPEVILPRLTRGRVPQYRHHNGRNLACCDIDGQRYYLGPYKSKASYTEYDRLISEWLAHGRVLSQDGEPERRTVVEVIAAYLGHAAEYYRKDGHQTSEYAVIVAAIKPLKELYGLQPADEFGPLKLQVVRETLLARNARRTTNKHVSRIKRMFRWAVAQQLVPGRVYSELAAVEGLKKGRTDARETAPISAVDDAVVDTTLPHLPDLVCDMVRLQRLMGARLCLLRPRDVDRSGPIWTYRPAEHKVEHHGRERVIFIGPKAQAILAPYLLRAADAYCFSPRDSERKRRAKQHANRKTPLSCGNRPGNQSHEDAPAVRGRAVRRGQLPPGDPPGVRQGIPAPGGAPGRGSGPVAI